LTSLSHKLQIKNFYPILFYLSRIEFKSLLLILPLTFIFGKWVISGAYIFILATYLLLQKIKNNDKIFIQFKILIFGILIAGINAVFSSSDFREGVWYFVATIIIPIIIFLTITNSNISLDDIKKFFDANIISGVILGIFSIYIVFVLGTPGFRISSMWEDYNIVAAYYMIIFFMILANIVHFEDRRSLIFYILSLIPVILGLFFTQTRGVWLSVLVALFFYLFKRPKTIFLAAIIIGVIITFFSSIVLDRFLSVKYFAADASSIGRLQAWFATILLLKEHWIFGAGFDSFLDLRYTVFDLYLLDLPHSHNTYLRLILELGIIGFIPYIYFMIISLIYIYKLNRKYKNNKKVIKILDALQLSFIGLFVAFMFEPYFSLYGNSTIIIWCLISLSIYIYNNLKRGENTSAF
jgi:O-antigen ligase